MARGHLLARGASNLALSLLHVLLWAKPALAFKLQPARASGRRLEHQLATVPEEGFRGLEGGPSQRGALVHFLFLLRDRLPNAEIWGDFFSAAPVGSWAAWAHCTDIGACQRHPSTTAFQLTIVPHVHSEWTIDLVSPEVRLMRSALEQAQHERPPMEKFVILGDTTLPVKPFYAVFRALTQSTESDYCYNTVQQWATANVSGGLFTIPKHWQWAVLNRTDALRLVQNWPAPVSAKYAWNVTLPDGTQVPRASFPPGPQAPDEQIESLVWGPMELKTSHPKAEMAEFLREHRRCRTYCIYIKDIRHVAEAGPDLQMNDARTFVTAYLISDPETNVSGTEEYTHPVTFNRVGVHTMSALRISDFLFVRKFRDNVPPDWSHFFALSRRG